MSAQNSERHTESVVQKTQVAVKLLLHMIQQVLHHATVCRTQRSIQVHDENCSTNQQQSSRHTCVHHSRDAQYVDLAAAYRA
jgi:predicted choloylglycine hydrolase